MKAKIFLALSILSLFFIANVAQAHQPRLVYKMVSTIETPFIISNPDISQAFYGRLKNSSADYFKVTLNTEQSLYLGLLTPDNNEAASEVSAIVIKLNSPDSDIKMSLGGSDSVWEKYYEDYAGDNYWQGPDTKKLLPAGDYLITISAKDNIGKYVLVVGQTESFPFAEAMKTLYNLPDLKMGFFGTSFLTVFSGIIGKYLLYSLIGLVIMLTLIVWYFIRRHNKNKYGQR
ncbi:MAG: hypothetical protein WAV11_03835 [Minisyncoccia bacterium]